LVELEIREGYDVLDISDATVKTIIIEKPDHTIISASATFLTDGSDGIIYYRTVAGDLSLAGDYGVQGYIESPNFDGYSTPTSFTVYANLPDWNP
jgi:hypothetical protein